jgi:hypothetical protein
MNLINRKRSHFKMKGVYAVVGGVPCFGTRKWLRTSS